MVSDPVVEGVRSARRVAAGGAVGAVRPTATAAAGDIDADAAEPSSPASGRTAMRDVRVVLLGGFDLFVDQRATQVPLAAQRVVALLAVRRRAVARSEVSGTLWPEATETHANGCLRTALWRLRRAEPALIAATPTHLCVAPCVRTDMSELARYAHRLLDSSDRLEGLPPGIQPLLGELLPGWYDDWVLFERERLRQLTLHALEASAERLLACGRFGAALEAAYAAIRSEPLRESAHRILIRIHVAEGNGVEAVRAYRCCADLLDRELGLAPSASLTSLVRVPTAASPRGASHDRPEGARIAQVTGR
jgi:DNA-binding SARP family transcriptional activator